MRDLISSVQADMVVSILTDPSRFLSYKNRYVLVFYSGDGADNTEFLQEGDEVVSERYCLV